MSVSRPCGKYATKKGYVLPWTRNFDAGLALVLNAAGIAWSRKPADLFCLATTFVSHSWGEAFEDFAFTLHRLLDAQTVVWICSLALWQHGDVSASLSSLDSCPFAVAMRATRRVLVLTDNSAETLERCWVVFEAALAHELGKDYNICLPDCDASSWQIVGTKLEKLNMEACKASNEKDKEEILRYIRRQPGGISALNSNVRKLARQAMERSQLMQAAVSGDLARIRRSSEEELKNWRNVRGRTVLHVTAAYAQVAAMVEVLQRTNFAHLNLLDEDARSPLAVAVECGRVASVLALLALRADVELRALNGPTALQLAAKHNHPEITQAIVDMKGDLELDTVFDGRPGHRALTIACHEGCAKIVRLLVENRANMEARTSTGACALHVAAWAGRAEAAAALLAGRADVNITTEDLFQRTPLNLALMNGHSAMVGLLLGAKATVTQDDSGDGDTAGTPANTGRSRHKRRPFKRYSRKDARREAAQVLLRHESSTSERSFQRTDSRVSQIDLPIGPTSSDASQASRLSLPKVHFQEGDPNVRFFPGEENNSSDQAEVYVYSPESGSTEESSDAASLRSTPGMVPADGLPPAPWAALAELTFIPPTARWIA
ncbi:unnamed protein product, partial [Effrenium voratum]